VLAHSSRPLTTVRDEIEFLRAYLYIEEAASATGCEWNRRGPAVAATRCLRLSYSVVENALKHGLAPKVGPGHLSISVCAETAFCAASGGRRHGTEWAAGAARRGLSNVAERLATLYQDRASVAMEAREGGGCGLQC